MDKTRASAVRLLDELIASFSLKRSPCVLESVQLLRQSLDCLGFDIFHQFPIQQYNAHVVAASNALLPIEEYDRSSTHAILIGNTKHLWPIFIEHLSRNPNTWSSEAHPLNQYTLRHIQSVCDRCLTQNQISFTLRFTFQIEKDKLVDFQRLSDVAGLAPLDPDSHLCVHKEYGPWFALRALLVLDAGYSDDPSGSTNCSARGAQTADDICSLKEREQVRRQWQRIQHALFDEKSNRKKPVESWRYWLALRDAYDIGRQHRYSEDQLTYHYTSDLDVLRRICRWE